MIPRRMDDCTFDIRNMWKRLDLALRKQDRGRADERAAKVRAYDDRAEALL